VHSLTKFISGASDIVAGAICGKAAFIQKLMDFHTGGGRGASVCTPLSPLHRCSAVLPGQLQHAATKAAPGPLTS
jgi:hypothetical protein